MDSVLLQLNNVRQAYGEQVVIHDVSLILQKGQIGCLLGPSGCGKTTALRSIAGFERISAGEILLDGICVSNASFCMPPEQRRIGMVFQDYALFPHLDVAGNIGFGLHRLTKPERERRVDEMLKIVHLTSLSKRYPHELSGGQQQRVALARALAPRPTLLLLDEPFSNLDVSLREQLSREVRDILKDQGITAILVTHDQAEAFAIADEIGVMHHGEMQQWDTAFNLYHRPANRFVADFVGQGVFLPGKIIGDGQIETELGVLKDNGTGQLQPISEICAKFEDCMVEVLLRPDDIVYDNNSPLRAIITYKAFQGAEILYTLSLKSGAKVLSLISSHHNYLIGQEIGIRLEIDDIVAFKQAL